MRLNKKMLKQIIREELENAQAGGGEENTASGAKSIIDALQRVTLPPEAYMQVLQAVLQHPKITPQVRLVAFKTVFGDVYGPKLAKQINDKTQGQV